MAKGFIGPCPEIAEVDRPTSGRSPTVDLHGNGSDRFGERRLRDVRVLPDLVEQHLLRDDLTGPLDQAGEHADRARRQRELGAVAVEQTVEPIELEVAEADAIDGQHENSAV